MAGKPTLERLQNAAAQGRLVIISGAGISCSLLRPDDSPIPNWNRLVEELRAACDETKIDPADLRLLNDLMPKGPADLHGDTLIEAAEILRRGFAKGEFEKKIASLCEEKPRERSETHVAIAAAAPAGIITFNYDRAHENAFREAGRAFEPMLYCDDDAIKALLARRHGGPPFLLKAHGSVERPESLVLTSSSYREVLSRYRPYRVLLQYALLHYTVLIVGFALRDRDFDLLLSTLEIELGKPEQRHVFITRKPGRGRKGREQRAAWAALTARFGVDPHYVPTFDEIPSLILSIAEQPGPLIRQLVVDAQSPDKSIRASVHDEIKMLGEVGRRQLRVALLEAMDRAARNPQRRSELIYALGGVADGEPEVARRLMDEIVRAGRDFAARARLGHTECAAHALLVLRRSRLKDDARRAALLAELRDPTLQQQMEAMDRFLARIDRLPRVSDYARAAAHEIEARARA